MLLVRLGYEKSVVSILGAFFFGLSLHFSFLLSDSLCPFSGEISYSVVSSSMVKTTQKKKRYRR